MKCNRCSGSNDVSEKNCITSVPIFANLTHDEMMEIAMITMSREYQKGENIYLAGKKHERLYVIHRGRVKITKISEAGKEQIIRVLGPGDFMGELSLFISSPLNSNAEALEPTTVCIIEGDKLSHIINKSPAIAIKIIEELSIRLQGAENLIESLGLHDVEQRVADALLKMANDKGEVILSMSKRDLASHIAMSQETLSRKLSYFQEMGWIEQMGHRKISILDEEKLNTIANI